MADQRITQLTELNQAGIAATDVLPIADVSASQTKKVTVKSLIQAGYALSDSSTIDLAKLDQASTTKLGAAALDSGAVTAAKLANDSSIAVDTTAPSTNNFEGRGYYNSSTGVLQVYSAGAYTDITTSIANDAVDTAQLADGAVTTAKIDAVGLNTAAIADNAITTIKLANDAVTADQLATNSVTADAIVTGAVGSSELATGAVTYDKIQATTATDVVLGRSSAGGGTVEEIACTSAGRSVISAANAADQRTVLGLGTLATQSGTFTGTHSGTSSGTNTGDQTIQLTGDVTGLGTGTFAATISNDVITSAKIVANAVTTVKIADDAVTAAKLADNSTAQTAAGAPGGSGLFVGQEYINTTDGIAYYWDGATWQNKAVSIAAATTSISGTVKVGTGLQMNTSGQLDHLNTVTTGTFTKVTVDAQGHVTTGTTLVASDVPDLDASKITTGTFNGNLFGTKSIAGVKLADSSTVQFGGAGSTSGVVTFPTAEFKGQYFYDELNQDLYIWSGSAWIPITIISGELVLAGTYNANTNLVASLTSAGSAAGLTVGSTLPAASTTNNRYYLVVSVSGTGTGNAPAVALAPPDMILSTGASWQLIDVSNTIAGQTATNISFTPYGNLASTTVQAALQELDDEKLTASGGVITGSLTIGNTGSFVFEGSTNDAYETTLAVVDPTADRTITLPNITGTIVTTGDTGTVTSTMLVDEIPVSKLADGTARQLLQTDAAGTGVEWTSNVDLPGTLDVTGAVTFDSTVSVAGTSTAASFIPTSSTAPSNGLYLSDTNAVSLASNSTERLRFAASGAFGLSGANYGTSGQVLTSNGSAAAPTWQTPTSGGGGDVFLASANAFTGANTFTNTTGQTFRQAATQDGILLRGRAGGTTSLSVEIIPTTLTASRVLTAPNVSGTIITTGDTSSVTNTMLAGSIAYSKLTLSNSIVNADISSSAAIALSKLATGALPTAITVASANIVDGTIVNADISASAAIAGTKISPDFGSQTITTTGIFSHAAGSAAAPTITFTGDTNSGVYSPGADTVAIATGGVQRVTVNSSGGFGVGVTAGTGTDSTGSGGHFLDAPGGAASFARNGDVANFNRIGSNGVAINFRRSGTAVGSIEVTASATSYVTSSDYRLKENVVPLAGAINRLSQLKPSRFNFIVEPTKTVDGFIAHEAQAVVPECVTGTKDQVDDSGNPVYQGIDQAKLTPLLTAALQEAVAKIEALEARLTAAGI